jgi:ribosomal protein S18 acetylase RimI-like enzyme
MNSSDFETMRILTMNDFESAMSLITKYQDGIVFPGSFADMLREAMEAGRIKVCLTESNESIPYGIGVIGQVSGKIHAIWVDDTIGSLDRGSINMLESKILEWCFEEIENPPKRIDFPKMTEYIKSELLRRGYVEYKRASMSASRDDFLKNSRLALPEGFALMPYRSDMRDRVANVIVEANMDHDDAIIYPEFFSSKEKALEFLEKLEGNELGEFIEDVSQVLVKGEQTVGFCMIVGKGSDFGISDIGISPDYQGKGLGKALLINTILNLLHSNDSVQTINLAVTLSNPARFLYEKSGFRMTDEFSAIIYSK